MSAGADILGALRRYWGYGAFRRLQEPIVEAVLGGRDVCVVMPTGGGKSLCYQLPAALRPDSTTVVISPLIALMEDQVAQLESMGLPATALHASLGAGEQERVWRRVEAGAIRLLYLSPERMARADTVARLQRVRIALFAIDEAHCISEWGHEFRPEYRQLSALRRNFPACPIAAFTASATRRVRHDILEQLALRDPARFIASFHRPNLRYWTRASTSATQPALLLAALRAHEGEAAIVYAPTIARVEETTAWLNARGVAAIAYHGRMEANERREHQRRWMEGEPNVLVGTIAFGLGINKADVRAVIHLSLPKSIEQYYQEAGRAGRDGSPAECLLLWQKRDAGLLAHFIGQIEDPGERERAWQRYHEVRTFVEAPVCRHRQISNHFGERVRWENCGAPAGPVEARPVGLPDGAGGQAAPEAACDVCGYEPEWLAGVAGTAKGLASRRGRQPGRSAGGPRSSRAAGAASPEADPDPELREVLRAWRKETAKAAGIPAYVVLHDRTLDELCRLRPRTLEALLEVPGIGEHKLARYGAAILAALRP